MNKDRRIAGLLSFFALVSVIVVAYITIVIAKEGIQLFHNVNLFRFLFGTEWMPTAATPHFGILPQLIGSFLTTLLALAIAIPIGVGCALFLSELAPHSAREILKAGVELLAGIPSVVYGFFGLVFIAPTVIRLFNIPTGLNTFTTSLVLCIMVLPTIVSLSEDAITAVPASLKNASVALGATKWETIVHITLPSAKNGILMAIILGFGRVIGETMIVLMLAGGSAIIPHSIFSPIQTMTGTIAGEMGEATYGSIHYHALFAIAVVLMLITLSFNILAEIINSKFKHGDK